MSLAENTSERRKDARFTVQATFRRHNKADSTRCTRSLGRKGRPAVEGRPETVVGGLLRACVGSALEVSARVEGVVHTSGCDLLLTFLFVMSLNEGVLRAIETSV